MKIHVIIMNLATFISTTIILLSVLIIKYNIIGTVKDFLNQEKHLLIIGVVSSRENFNIRQTVRRTWKNFIRDPEIQFFFLIGRDACEIPPQDRVDEYSCKEWPMSLEGVADENTELSAISLHCETDTVHVPSYLGFNFIVQHPIVVKKLGLWCHLLNRLKRVKVSLKNAVSAERITSSTFIADEDLECSSPIVYKTVRPHLLPKGFEGQVVVEMSDWPMLLNVSCRSQWSNAVGAMRIMKLLRKLQERPQALQTEFFTPVTMAYTIHDLSNLKNHVKTKHYRMESWQLSTALTESKLKKEQSDYGDILFLNVVDVYRNLPSKVLQFLKWTHSNKKFSYLLKTDDDSFIDIPAVVRELKIMEKDDDCPAWWWSSFREGWPVNAAGKWREDNYHSLTYPAFPCGAGYVLDYKTVKFLAKNANDLYTGFQGEDVSMGIWLAGLNPCRHVGRNATCVWSCDEQRHALFCNIAQLSEDGLLQAWETYDNS